MCNNNIKVVSREPKQYAVPAKMRFNRIGEDTALLCADLMAERGIMWPRELPINSRQYLMYNATDKDGVRLSVEYVGNGRYVFQYKPSNTTIWLTSSQFELGDEFDADGNRLSIRERIVFPRADEALVESIENELRINGVHSWDFPQKKGRSTLLYTESGNPINEPVRPLLKITLVSDGSGQFRYIREAYRIDGTTHPELSAWFRLE